MRNFYKLSEEEFTKLFRPIENPNHSSGILFETYGKDLEFVLSHNISKIWTLLCEGSDIWIANGFHRINRLNYIVTTADWVNDHEVEY